MITLEKIQMIFEANFSEPFLEKGLVECEFIEHAKVKTLQIQIGRRDISLNENGEVTDCGTYFG
jgi:hypothetical protein